MENRYSRMISVRRMTKIIEAEVKVIYILNILFLKFFEIEFLILISTIKLLSFFQNITVLKIFNCP